MNVLDVRTQIGGKWALDLHFTLLLIPFSMLILPFHLGCFKYTSLRYGHLNTEEEVWSLLLHFLAIWALEHHFPKLERERSIVPSITLPGDLGTWTPRLKIWIKGTLVELWLKLSKAKRKSSLGLFLSIFLVRRELPCGVFVFCVWTSLNKSIIN